MSDMMKALEAFKRSELEAMEKGEEKGFPVIIAKDSYFAKEISYQTVLLKAIIENQTKEHENYIPAKDSSHRKIHHSAQFKIDVERPLKEEDMLYDHGDIIAEVCRMLVDHGLNYFEMNEILYYADKILKERVLRRTLKDKCHCPAGKDKEPE